MKDIEFEEGSFRDPAGKIFYHKNKVYRILNEEGGKRLDFLEKKDLLKNLVNKKFVIPSKRNSQSFELKEFINQKLLNMIKLIMFHTHMNGPFSN